MKKENYMTYAKEVVLTVLNTASYKYNELKEIGDISAVEILEKEVIGVYEKIYHTLHDINVAKMDEKDYVSFKKMVDEIRKKNNLDDSIIRSNVKKRFELNGKSGSEVVEKFYKYNLKRELDKKSKILEKYNKLVKEEETLEILLKDTIQEEEQFDIIYKLQSLREKSKNVEKFFRLTDENISLFKKRLDSKWSYEIYGLVTEDELLKTYNETFNLNEGDFNDCKNT